MIFLIIWNIILTLVLIAYICYNQYKWRELETVFELIANSLNSSFKNTSTSDNP